jgi:serine/threonine-protein kinase
MINEHIGDYRIVRLLGRGGVGSVWEAETHDGLKIALKVLNPPVLGNKTVVQKFFQEAFILAKLDHPNITKLLDVFPLNDACAIAMEYIRGVELKELLSQYEGPLPIDLACKAAAQILDALQYAYANGVLHCDIKPGNIMMDHNRNAKIMDFGIARMMTGDPFDSARKMLSVNYAPPERFDPHLAMDVRGDIYSLGLVFYEMFAGCRAFRAADSSGESLGRRNGMPASPETVVHGLPCGISQAILKALKKNPAERHQDFRAFAKHMQIDHLLDKRCNAKRS